MSQRGTKNDSANDAAGGLEQVLEAANTLVIERPLANLLTTTGAEMVSKDDLWNCLFGLRQVSPEAEHEIARHLGAEAAEARMSGDVTVRAVEI